MYRLTARFTRLTLLTILLLGTCLAVGTRRVRAQAGSGGQSEPSPYWQYDAPGPLGVVKAADIDHDGIEEFVVTTEDHQVVLLSATGQARWTYQTPDQTSILELSPINVDGADNPYQQIILATADQLILLDRHGEVRWTKPLALPPIPTMALPGASAEALRRNLSNRPVALRPIDRDADGNDEILVLLQSGLVQVYDGQGEYQWGYPDSAPASDEPRALVEVGDVNGDGLPEIVFSYYIRYSRILLLDANGRLQWDRPLSGRITSLSLVAWDEDSPMDIVVGNSFRSDRKQVERVIVYDSSNGMERWTRTPNRTVTALAGARLPQGPALVVGTNVGKVLSYNREGARYWQYQPQSPDRAIVAISATPVEPQPGQPALALTLAPASPTNNMPANVLLLDDAGQALRQFQSAAAAGQTALVDVNNDGISELLLASFGTLSLTDPGTGARKNAQAWDYRLYAAPVSTLVADLTGDGADELLIGTRDGRLHLLDSATGQANSIVNPGGEISHLALLQQGPDAETLIVAVHNHTGGSDLPQQSGSPVGGVLELVHPSGRVVWPEPVTVPGRITALTVGNINRDLSPEMVIGTSEGELIAYSVGPRELWRTALPGAVQQVALVEGEEVDSFDVVAVSTLNQIYRYSGRGQGSIVAYYNLEAVNEIFPLPHVESDDRALLMTTDQGTLSALAWDGTQSWQWELPQGEIVHMQPAGETFLAVSDAGELLNLDVRTDEILWQQPDLGAVSALYWGDLDGGGGADVAVGTRDGRVYLYTDDGRLWDSLNLSSNSSVFQLASVRRHSDGTPQLLVITDNGVVQLFEAKPNRPPLLVNPHVDVGPGRYDIRISVIEEEGDSVLIGLQTLDMNSGEWRTVDEKAISGRDNLSSDNLIFNLEPATDGNVRYRFTFNDGTHQGTVTPTPGPPPQPVIPLSASLIVPALAAMALFSAVFAVRQARSTSANVRRFYSRVKQQPQATLELLDEQYRRNEGSPDFLLNLANQARTDDHQVLANLADGLFLLAGRPGAALVILNSALADAEETVGDWRSFDTWRMTFATCQALWEALSITELSLLCHRLEQMVREGDASGISAQYLETLLQILGSLRDSERVDLVDDRLVYLHEASVLVRQVDERLAPQPVTIEKQLVAAIQERVQGLIRAEMEMLRGQAQLVVTLKTKRAVPEDGLVVVAVEIRNQGRAPAENVVVEVQEDPAYDVHSPAETIPVIWPGRGYVADFVVHPHVEDRVRAAFSISYDDRIQNAHQMAFADMVNLLPPQRAFTPLANPYMPGTPLRGNSSLFYGREDLFDFIIENAGQLARRNVLILVGQRRTGKTSALLRLAHYVPNDLVPIYIDCQSLGIVPGMAALFHDLAWYIADALDERGIEIAVPDSEAWQSDPTRLFQHQFIPDVKQQLPDESTLLLVFDEFEAFENLVEDEILPSTLFTYLRHLMQHSEGLSFVFVGTRRLEEMGSDYWSVLFNIALYRQIDFLSQEAAMKLVTEPVAPHIVYDDLALDKIWRVTAGHPYFLQLVCYTLVKRANSRSTGYVTISDVNAALEEMLRLGEVHFAYLWQRSSHTERALLAAVAHLMDRDVPFHPSDLVHYLEQYGFRFDPADVTAGLNKLVEREIMSEVTIEGTTFYTLKIGLVGLWAAQNKSLSKLYESNNGAENEYRSKRLLSY
ncbi:MAG TPA: PQQ-binding-like beta-propeller repeat protein [Candidatus Sulfomarinibacteraceae bacterium]|nr:PQQ-binding-like beta-propeller repeat protein [Candidatus Sulfomarinibacteraceae bacterium]